MDFMVKVVKQVRISLLLRFEHVTCILLLLNDFGYGFLFVKDILGLFLMFIR